jgi:hypothetical protein
VLADFPSGSKMARVAIPAVVPDGLYANWFSFLSDGSGAS